MFCCYRKPSYTESTEPLKRGKVKVTNDISGPGWLNVSKNDKLKIIENNENQEFVRVKSVKTQEEGLVPKALVKYEKHLSSEEWYFDDVTRMEVENRLLTENDDNGTFLIRKSENRKYPFVLSVKYTINNRYKVCHYRIFKENKEYYISPEKTFPTLAALVKKYQVKDYNICTTLKCPCQKPGVTKVYDLSPLYAESWLIPKKEIKKGERIGRGNFANVFKGTWNNNRVVAIKEIVSKSSDEQKELIKEIGVMKKLRHNNVVSLYGYCTDDGPMFIVEEYVPNGPLDRFLKNCDLYESKLLYIAFQVADGMDYLTTRNTIHRDLAARNVLVGHDLNVKISDFGLSRTKNSEGFYKTTSEAMIPIRWTAPEAIETSKFDVKSDVWSFGILIIELFTKAEMPYIYLTDNGAVYEKIKQGHRMPKPKNMPENIYEQILKCWNKDPEERPNFSKLKYFFDEYNTI